MKTQGGSHCRFPVEARRHLAGWVCGRVGLLFSFDCPHLFIMSYLGFCRSPCPILALAVLASVSACAPTSERVVEKSPDPVRVDDGPSGAKAAPEHTFQTLDGEDVTFADFAGEVAVVNLWGTWCLPCRRELPELAALADAYADRGVRIIGVAIDSGGPEEIKAFLEEFGVDYPIWLTGMEAAIGKFGAVGFPFTLIVDREGWIRKEYLGPQTYESLSREIDALLN